MHIAQLWRYPVKSMVGETVDMIELDDLGIVGDRTWAARDLERGGIRGAKKIGGWSGSGPPVISTTTVAVPPIPMT